MNNILFNVPENYEIEKVYRKFRVIDWCGIPNISIAEGDKAFFYISDGNYKGIQYEGIIIDANVAKKDISDHWVGNKEWAGNNRNVRLCIYRKYDNQITDALSKHDLINQKLVENEQSVCYEIDASVLECINSVLERHDSKDVFFERRFNCYWTYYKKDFLTEFKKHELKNDKSSDPYSMWLFLDPHIVHDIWFDETKSVDEKWHLIYRLQNSMIQGQGNLHFIRDVLAPSEVKDKAEYHEKRVKIFELLDDFIKSEASENDLDQLSKDLEKTLDMTNAKNDPVKFSPSWITVMLNYLRPSWVPTYREITYKLTNKFFFDESFPSSRVKVSEKISTIANISNEVLRHLVSDVKWFKELYGTLNSYLDWGGLLNQILNSFCYWSSERVKEIGIKNGIDFNKKYDINQVMVYADEDLENISEYVQDDLLIENLETEFVSCNEDCGEETVDSFECDRNSFIDFVGYNELIYGAPGTGKSHKTDEIIANEKIDYKTDKIHSYRVVFHPEYSYFDFIGSYKPVTVYKLSENSVFDKKIQGEPCIDYKFVPGPFTKVLVESYEHPTEINYLIIEELNRANAASVFGDVFQLLDRNKDGWSDYGIYPSEELNDYLRSMKCCCFDASGMIRIPSNMVILATMNSADQGVNYLDSAFKRRWNFVYQELVYDAISDDLMITYGGVDYQYKRFLKVLNDKLSWEMSIEEDRLIGPWFISSVKYMPEDKHCSEKDKMKIIYYLWDDVMRYNRKQFFSDSIHSLGELARKFNAQGTDVFELGDKLKNNTSIEIE